MTEPRTEAGRKLFDWLEAGWPGSGDDVLQVEAEAAEDYKRALYRIAHSQESDPHAYARFAEKVAREALAAVDNRPAND